MTVKRFIAADMRKALELVRAELGPDAIILSSQRTARGVEIITQAEADMPAPGANTRKDFAGHFDREMDWPLASDGAWRREPAPAAAKPEMSPLERELERSAARREAPQRAAPRPARPAVSAVPTPAAQVRLDRQMQGLADQMRDLTPVQPDTGGERLEQLQNEIADMRLMLEQQMYRQQSHRTSAPVSPAQDALQTRLERLGLPASLSAELAAASAPGRPLNQAWREALARLAKRLPVDSSNPVAKGGVFAFVGPTGVGKTTTIAKLAARYVIDHGLGKVALITTDTYRVGAHDQLRALGRILNVPVRVVDESHTLPQTLAGLRRFPLVLIDTAGFRQGDPLLKQQEEMLASCAGVERILTLACNSQMQTLKASVHAYSQAPLRGCTLTKLDECASLGEALAVLSEHKVPVLYGTDGQDIPRDLNTASAPALIAKAVALLKAQTTGVAPAAAG